MQKRLVRAALAVTFLSTLLIPIGGNAGSKQEELDGIKARLERIRSDRAEAESAYNSTKAEVDGLNKSIGALQMELNLLDDKIARIQSQVATEQAAIDRKQAQIDEVEAIATAQARILYRSGGTEMLDTLLNSQSLAEVSDRIEMLSRAGEQNTDSLIRYHRLQLEIEADRAELFETQKQLVAYRDTQKDAQKELESYRAELALKMAKLGVKVAKLEKLEGDLEADALKITQSIQAQQAYQSVAALGESATGFIWPLNGAVTSGYGPRWGRMHTGIDIDGVSGQTIVAAKGGVVILAEYYSGYGNAVVVDHGGGVATLYAHMSSFGVSNGEEVLQGQSVGTVGCTGSCTGDHLHFEVRINGEPVNPMNYLP